MTIFTLFFFTVLVANVEFAGFAPKQKYMDCCKILTKKEPMRTQGLGLPYIIKCNMAASLIKATFMILKRFEIFLVIQNPNTSSKLTKNFLISFVLRRVLETMHQDLPIFSSSVFLLKNALETVDHGYNIVQFVSLRKVMVLAHQMILSTNHLSTQTVNSSVHHRSLKNICQFEKSVNV